jgi:dipeptidyl-peptidase-4
MVLVRYAGRQIFRHSSVARFAVVLLSDLATAYDIDGGNELQICTWRGDSLIFIRNNTIFYVSRANITADAAVQISPDGVPGVIYHGIPDWVYEEEVLGSDAAAWISPDGKYLAYASFDDTNVETFTYEIYGDGKGEYQYPEEVKLKYPKVGTANPTLGFTIQDVSDPSLKSIKLNNASAEFGNDHILGTVFWITDTKLGAIWTNRRQNRGVFVTYTPPSAEYEIVS